MNLHHYPYCYIQCLGRTKYVTTKEPSWGRKWIDSRKNQQKLISVWDFQGEMFWDSKGGLVIPQIP